MLQPIPDDILKQFDAVLGKKAVSVSLRDDYRQWLRKKACRLYWIFFISWVRMTGKVERVCSKKLQGG
jgi:hypothetical protein